MNNNSKYSNGKSFKVYAVIISTYCNPEHIRIIKILQKEAIKNNCRFVFFSTDDDFGIDDLTKEGEKSILDIIDIQRFDAIILFSESFKDPDPLKAFIRGANIENVPVITIDSKLPGASVHFQFDYSGSFREICEHVISKHNYNSIYFMAGIPGNSFSEERHRIFQETMHSYGKPYNVKHVYYGHFWETPTISAMNQIFEDVKNGQEMPDCIICANDAMAVTACNYLTQNGYRVPEDIAISGFDGMECEEFFSPRLTTAITDYPLLASELMKILSQDISGDYISSDVIIKNRMQIGCSCGCDGIKALPSSSKLMELRTSIQAHMHFEQTCGKLVTDNGIDVIFDDVMSSIHDYLPQINCDKMWFIVNEDFAHASKTGNIENNLEYSYNLKFTQKMSVWDCSATDKNYKGFEDQIEFGELLPSFSDILETDKTIFVLPVHTKGIPLGYIVLCFDENTLRYNECYTFVNSFKRMIGMEYEKIHLLQVYITDPLTELYNRTGFNQRLKSSISEYSDQEISLIAVDIMRLKDINDSWGHEEGDSAIKEIAQILSDCAPESIVSRIEGDEFIICSFGNDMMKKTTDIIHSISHTVEKRNLYTDKYYQLNLAIDCFSCDISSHTFDYFLKKVDDLKFSAQNMM